MTEKMYALDLNNEEWVDWLDNELKQPKFRADQICQWLWQKRVFEVEEMTNLSKPLRDLLEERVDFGEPVLIHEERSGIDGTRKYLWQLRDKHSVESVLMRQGERFTACISTQVGCPLQCTFCATGLSGYVRNLTAGEIAGQFLAMEKSLGCEINNVVYMGMGEPFLNTEAVLKSVRMLNSPKMRNLGIRHITISTSGVIPGIRALAESGLGVRLAVSLHAVDDQLRSMLMPVNQTFPVHELRKSMQDYQKITGDRISIEYVLFGGINDSVEHARDLLRYLKGIHVFINLIPYNAVDDRYEKSKPENILKFRRVLETAGFETEIRQEQGADINAACGQLRRKTMAGNPCALEPKAYSLTNSNSHKDELRSPQVRSNPVRTLKKRSEVRIKNFEDAPKRESASKDVTKAPSGGFVAERGRRKPDSIKTTDARKDGAKSWQERKPARTYKHSDSESGRSEAAPKSEYGTRSRYEKKAPSDRVSGEGMERNPSSADRRWKTDRSEQERKPARTYKRSDSESGRSEAAPKSEYGTRSRYEKKTPSDRVSGEGMKRSPSSADKRRKTDKPEQDRYRSGKIKEARPSYITPGEGSENERKVFNLSDLKPTTGRGASRGEKRSSDTRSSAPRSRKTEFGEDRKSEGFSQKRAPKTGKTGRKTPQRSAAKNKKQK